MRKKIFLTSLIVLLILIFLFGLVPFLIPVPPLQGTLPPRELGDPDSQFVTVNGLDLHVKISGQGEPTFILLHGFGASLFSWREVSDPLAEIGTVVSYDRPAFGLTERPLKWEEGHNPYTPQAQVDLVVSLMDHLGIKSAILVGNSAGGTVALNTALSHPERVEALVLVDAAVYRGGGAPAWIQPLLSTPQMDHLGPLLARMIAFRGDDFIKNAWSDPSRITAETLEGYHLPLRVENWDKGLWELTKVSSQGDLATRVQEIQLPALVISGKDDQIVPIELSLRLEADLPQAQLAVFNNCGHLPQEECPQDFMAAVKYFLADLKK
jgi:pimeloyl-ACP methyl ester carboxylesterase